MGLAAKQFAAKHNDAVCSVFLHLGMNNVIRFSARSHAIEMVFIETGHAGGSTRSFMLKSFFKNYESQIRFHLRSLSVPIYISITGERA